MRSNRSLPQRGVALIALFTLLTTSCGGKGGNTTSGSANQAGSASPLSDQAYVQLKDAPPGLDLRVSEGKAGPPAFDRRKLAPATKIPDGEVNAMLARAKPIQSDPSDQQSFALRPGSQPVPRTGQTVTGTFPPAPSTLLPPVANDAGKDLKVLRWMPEGKVPLAPELSVTFSQPMIAVTAQTDASATTPVKLDPTPKGSWRWIGTRTILFDPTVRFPQATTYHVEIPANTKSANGGVLKTAQKFTFETPAPTVVTSYPASRRPQHLDVPMFVMFDQKIDSTKVLASIKVTANGKPWAMRLMDTAEITKAAASKREDEKQLAAMVEHAQKNEQEGRWLAFRATQEFPTDASINIEIAAGTPSAEGPNTTKAPQTLGFHTYPPLKIVRAECGYNGNCPPGTAFVIQFNNPLDVDKFDEGWVSVSPEIPGMKIVQSGQNLIVQGATKARTAYKAVVSASVLDEFGQTLGKEPPRTWSVGDAHPTFFGPQGMVVVDPSANKPTLDFFSTNYEQLKVRLFRVTPDDLDAYNTYLRNRWNKDKPPVMPGRKVFDQLVKTTIGHNDLVETSVDLGPALTKGLGHAIAIVEPYPWTEKYDPPRFISWVQSTRLAVDASVDADNLIAFATELDTGKPASGVALELRPFGQKAASDDKGLASIPLGIGGVKGTHYLVARRGDDVAFVTDHTGYGNETWVKQARTTNLAWYVIDDRKLYKPGEEVTLKGWLRTIDYRKNGDVGGINDGVSTISYKVRDSRNNELAKGTMPVSAVGGFDTKFTLPKTPNLGSASIELEAQGKDPWSATGGTYRHMFQIEEFRRPEFEVSAKASQGPFLVGSSGDVTVSAKYYSGGPLPGAPVNWFVTANQTNFTPPNRDDYIFGSWQPWWGHRGMDYDGDEGLGYGRGGRGYKPPKTWNLAAKTDATGAQTLHLDFLSVNPAMPMSVTTSARVTDVNRQAWSASAALIVHPSSLYVGLKTKKPFVEKGTPFDIDVIGVDLDGKAVPGAKIEVKTVRLDWEYKKGKYVQKEVDPQTCAVIAAKDATACTFGTKEGGTYEVTAIAVDAKGRPNQTKLTFWVTGGKQPKARDVAQEVVQLIPDKKEYTAGNTAELLVQAPFYPAEGIVSWRRSGIVKTERISISGPTRVITVPISDAMVPNMFVQVDLVGMAARLDDKGDPDPRLPPRPAYAVGQINLPVPPKQRTLAVTVTPNAAKVAPGESARLAVTVKDAAGRPVPNADAAVIVVDEAVLALTGYQFPNPIDTFYGARGADARDHYLRGYVKLARPDPSVVTASTGSIGHGRYRNGDGDAAAAAPGGLMDGAEGGEDREGKLDSLDEAPMKQEVEKKNMRLEDKAKESKPDGNARQGQGAHEAIAIRSNFNPLAAFSPAVKTDAAGMATVDIKVPDNLTRYRI
ncbi:MAG: hypothetical protein H6Q90_3454, partial [Deltaproteobacteria bacterium]|nr:hypothetical protein [Deltaproteobacteria bacterium]